MAKVVAVANQKGGVAKTTTAVNIASYLAKFGKKTLLIDLDPQGNATSGCGVSKEQVQKSIYHVLIGEEALDKVIIESPFNGLFVAPADISLVGAEVELVTASQRESRLATSIKQFISINEYDYVFIDTPPSLGLLTLNALAAANSVLIPMQCEYYALEGLAQLYKTISLVKHNLNKGLQIEGLVFSMVDLRANLTLQVIEEVKKFLKEKVYATVIPRNIRLAEAPSHGKPILSYDKTSKGAEAYEKLAREFLKRNEKITTPSPLVGEGEGGGVISNDTTPHPAPSPTRGEGEISKEAIPT